MAEDSSSSNRNGRDAYRVGGTLDTAHGMNNIEPEVRYLRAADAVDRISSGASEMEAVQDNSLDVRRRAVSRIRDAAPKK